MGNSQNLPANEAENLRFGNTARFTAVMVIFCVLFLAGIILNINIGSVSIGTGDIFSMLWKGCKYGIANIFTGGAYSEKLSDLMRASTENQIIFSIRLPRMILAAILGGALSVSGYLLQVFFRNPIAGPFVLGISSGAKMVVGITMIFLAPFIGSLSSISIILAAFLGSLLITSVVLVFAKNVRSMSMLLVIGIMVGYICSAVTDFCINFANDHDVVNLKNWSMGSFSGANWGYVEAALLMCIPGVIMALLLSKPISAYALGEGYARSMGIKIKPFRVILILLSSLLSSCVTALAGPISFVGIAVPHIARSLLKSSKPLFVIPATFVSGAVFCMFCDLIARTVFAPTELTIGTVTSIFGAPIVIYMMIKRRSGRED